MRIFVSWSKPRARAVAIALHDWLKLTIQCAEPWVSTKDIDAGRAWGPEIMGALKEAKLGIIVVTPENQASQFLQFEAGACAMSTETPTGEKAKVCPYLVDMKVADLEHPLSQFHTKLCDREGTFELLRSVNNVAKVAEGATPVGDVHLRTLFEKTWEDLEKKIQAAIELDVEVPKTSKSDRDLLEEVVGVVRSLDGRLRSALSGPRSGSAFDGIDLPQPTDVRVLRNVFESSLSSLFSNDDERNRILEQAKRVLKANPHSDPSGED